MQKSGFIKRRLEDTADPAESHVAPGTRFVGTLSGTEGVRISGLLKGNVQSEGLVWIRKGGKIVGNIKSRSAIIEGELKGNIDSPEQVELRSEAHVIGNIQTSKIAIAEGSFFQGEILMPRKEDKPIKFVEKRENFS
jgi:cytoskeletal protein CcmA (bactofilin family)